MNHLSWTNIRDSFVVERFVVEPRIIYSPAWCATTVSSIFNPILFPCKQTHGATGRSGRTVSRSAVSSRSTRGQGSVCWNRRPSMDRMWLNTAKDPRPSPGTAPDQTVSNKYHREWIKFDVIKTILSEKHIDWICFWVSRLSKFCFYQHTYTW